MTHNASTLAMNTLRFDENCFIRSLVHNGKFYLSSRDICSLLGYTNVSQELNKHCRPDYIVELKDFAFNPDDIETISSTEVQGETALQQAIRMREKWLEEPGYTNYLVAAKSQKLRHFRSGCTKK